MSAIADFTEVLKGWVNRKNISDATVVSWVRMAEERINQELRYKDMLTRQEALFVDNCSPLPPDWLSVEFVKYVRVPLSNNINIKRGRPFRFVSKDEYWDRARGDGPYTAAPVYTIIGNDLFVTGDIDNELGVSIEIGAYRKVPPLGETSNWLYDNHIGLYTFASLAASAPWLMEDERMATWESKATQLIGLMNESSKTGQTGASPMKMRRRSFG
jgi:hypothetical protein